MLVGSQPRRVAVIGGVRIPFARAHGAYASVGNQEMLTAALKAVVDRYGLKGERLGDVIAGAVMKHSSQWNLAREALLDSGLAPETPGLDVQRACGTSIEAAIQIGNKIALGQIDAGIAGGVDTVSDPPIVFGRGYQQLMLKSFRAKTFGSRKSRPFSACGPGISSRPIPAPGSREPASRWASTPSRWRAPGKSRAPNRMSSRSRATCNASRAWAEGFMSDLVVPYLGLNPDNNVRADTTPREAREAQAVVRRRRDADRRQQHADDRRRGGRVARDSGTGRARAICRCRPGSHMRKRRQSISSAVKDC